LAASGIRIERQHAIDDVIRAPPVGQVQLPRFRGWLEGAQYYACGVRAQLKRLAGYEHGL
jgi:hypothetical protein